MPTFLDLPYEICSEIARNLPAFDIAVLSLTCNALQISFGPNNQFLWFNKLKIAAQGAPSDERKSFISFLPLGDDIVHLKSNFQYFDSCVNYWDLVKNVFMGKQPGGCGRCLSKRIHESKFIRFGAKGSDLTRRYCEPCFKELFYQTSSVLEIYPELSISPEVQVQAGMILSTSLAQRPKEDPKGYFYIRKTTTRKLIEGQIGKLSEAKTQSSRFLAHWMLQIRRMGESLDQSISVVVDEYTRCFKRFHPIIEPNMLHHCLWKFIVEDFQHQGKNCNSIPLPSDTSDIIGGIGDYLQAVAKNPDINDTCWDLASMKANEYLLRLFGARDGDYLDFVAIYHPGFLIEYVADWAIDNISWMSVFSNAFKLQWEGSVSDDVCCYWCLRKSSKNPHTYRGISRKDIVIPSSSIVVHLIRCHPEKLGKRPKDPIGKGWSDMYRTHHRGIPPNPALWNFLLEDIPGEPPDFIGYIS
ncbi:hypothetical protein TWF718_009751 [Orbilia javanica]|uniref:F-box domain-containing protein n=1 Tax=Orbilia javanica TaxID=47235 RepID=A0AAN8MQ96_9PEZI